MTGIIVADENEINKFDFKVKETKQINQFVFTVFENNLVFVHSGIGIANAAAATQALIENFSIKEIYNFGAVGANENLNVYDVVIPEKIFYHDVTTPWYDRGQTPGEDKFYLNSLTGGKQNNLASGSSFVTDIKEINVISKELNVDIFDMETAAMAQIALKNKVPLKVIKVVSDSIGDNDEAVEDINIRIAKAGQIAFDYLMNII